MVRNHEIIRTLGPAFHSQMIQMYRYKHGFKVPTRTAHCSMVKLRKMHYTDIKISKMVG